MKPYLSPREERRQAAWNWWKETALVALAAAIICGLGAHYVDPLSHIQWLAVPTYIALGYAALCVMAMMAIVYGPAIADRLHWVRCHAPLWWDNVEFAWHRAVRHVRVFRKKMEYYFPPLED